MGDQFDLRAAGSLIPNMTGSEQVTKQIIDAVEFYNDTLNPVGKAMLIKYVLKAKLNQNAKMRLEKSYTDVETLLSDMKKFLITKKSTTVLFSKLNNEKQGNRELKEFASTIQQLLYELTLAQSEHEDTLVESLNKVNEKIAINTFANGLRNSELRTIIKARNFKTLREAIAAAEDEEAQIPISSATSSTQSVFHFNSKKPFQPHNRNFYNFKNREL